MAKLLDMQHDPALRYEMAYVSPTTGDGGSLSFHLSPVLVEALRIKGTAVSSVSNNMP